MFCPTSRMGEGTRLPLWIDQWLTAIEGYQEKVVSTLDPGHVAYPRGWVRRPPGLASDVAGDLAHSPKVVRPLGAHAQHEPPTYPPLRNTDHSEE